MNKFKIMFLSMIVFAFSSQVVYAKPCPGFNVEGKWKNEIGYDLVMTQDGCNSATLTDPAREQSWKFDFNGGETVPPASYIEPFPNSIGKMLKTMKIKSTLLPNGAGVHFQMTFHANFPAWSFSNTIDGLITYEGTATAFRNTKGQIIKFEYRTDSIVMTNIDGGQVIDNETKGFLQGANVILNFFKSLIWAELKRP